jgi:hypothetical protein
MAIEVNIDNYARAEVASQVDRFLGFGAAVNGWTHIRTPTPLDQQSVIRMNRDTLYSVAVVDAGAGATVTLPDAGGRYLTVMVMDEDGYVVRVFHDAGVQQLAADEVGGGFALLIARILVDPTVPEDVAEVNRLQDLLVIDAPSARPWSTGRYDAASFQATKKPLLELGLGLHDSRRTFGSRDSVDPVRFLIGTAGGFGGLPEEEAYYAIRATHRPVGSYELRVVDVPADGFWSVSVYNRDGYFDENPYGSYSVNDVTAVADDDGAVTIHFGPEPDGSPNYLYVKDGWNYVARMYRPRASILDGTWTFPEPEAQPAP